MKKLLLAIFAFAALTCHAQYELEEEESKGNLGFGLGISYGGIGARLSFLPDSHLGIFGAGGYNLNGFAYTIGAQGRLLPGKKVVPVFMAMYGYNAVIIVQGAEHFNKTYYGPTFGGGVEIHSYNRQNFFTIELLAPVRSQEFKNHLQDLKSNPSIEMSDPWPVTFSFGYHLKF